MEARLEAVKQGQSVDEHRTQHPPRAGGDEATGRHHPLLILERVEERMVPTHGGDHRRQIGRARNCRIPGVRCSSTASRAWTVGTG